MFNLLEMPMRTVGGWRLAIVAAAMSLSAQKIETPKIPVKDSYHGITVIDEYRWLEDGHDPKVLAWSRAQNRMARAYLEKLPARAALREQLTTILTKTSVSYSQLAGRSGRWFAMKRDPAKQQPVLVMMKSVDEPRGEEVIVDPNSLDSQTLVSIDWFRPSPDGKLVAVSLSRAGSEAGDLHVFEADTGKEVGQAIERVNGGTAGGDAAWTPDGGGLFYTRYPRRGERPDADLDFYQRVFYHKLGTRASEDRYELGNDAPKIAEFRLECDETGRVLASMQNGDSGDFLHFLRDRNGRWRQMSRYTDRLVDVRLGPGNSLYAISRKNAARGKIVALPGERVLVPESDGVLTSDSWGSTGLLIAGDRIYVVVQLGGPEEIRAFDRAGKRVTGPAVGTVASVGGMARGAKGEILFATESYLRPAEWRRFIPAAGKTERTSLVVKPAVDLNDCEVAREFAVSQDGTKVPLNVIYRKGTKRDGKNPAWVTGYGGYGLSESPMFLPTLRVLLERGFVIGIANLRGGGEYGETWHEQGKLTHKQNVFDDFAAVLRHVVERGYTTPARLAIQGGSNGGLLMGAILTQHPELCRTVVSSVGIYDMLRSEQSPNGAFNVVEFGTVKEREQFEALYAYSPYHHVKEGEKYPIVLFMTGQNDARVDPMHSRKMTARLQAVGAKVLLRTDEEAGHGGGKPLRARIEDLSDAYAFVVANVVP